MKRFLIWLFSYRNFGILGFALILVLTASYISKINKNWPPENQLLIAEGFIKPNSIFEGDGYVKFYLEGYGNGFRYDSLYGRKLGAVRNALRNSGSLILVKYEPNDNASSPPSNEDFFYVYKFVQDERTIVSYETAQETFNNDAKLFPWLIGFFLLSSVFLFNFEKLKKRHGKGKR